MAVFGWSRTYLAYYESLINISAPVQLQMDFNQGVCFLRRHKDQQRTTVQECDANEA